MTAYYNEIDPFAAEWLRELIRAGFIAPGHVDTRSIEDVRPHDLDGFTQCHFFAGAGVWSYALRASGWHDDRPVWTGSCPCQPFSAAGKGNGFADERHLWPAFHHLISQCRPRVVFGEQVASKDGLTWIDLVQTDLEGTGYTCGAVDTCSAGYGAPHIRQRLYWVADSFREGLEGHTGHGHGKTGRAQQTGPASPCCEPCGMGHTEHMRRNEGGRGDSGGQESERCESGHEPDRPSSTVRPRPTNGFWGAADWLLCRDGRWRPVEPGTFPLAHGAAARVGRLRGYGNAINAQQAQAFIEAYMGTTTD